MTEIYLIRHGEAEGNVFRRIHGQYDSLLTPRGQEQVACLQKRFEQIPIAACYSSDLTRTSLTARAIYVPKGLKLRRDPRFREVGIGIWEDVPFGYLDHFDPEQMHYFNHDPMAWHVPGAETYEEFTARFIDGLTDAARENEGKSIAVFAHGAVIRCTLMRLFFNNQVTDLPFCDNTGVCKLIYDSGKFTYGFLNDNSHLPAELSTFALQFWWRSTGNRKDVNLYYVPFDPSMEAESVEIPPLDPRGFALAALLHDRVVGVVSMGAPEGDMGRVLGISLRKDLDGRLYGDQLLGTVFSHFRRLGCRQIVADPGFYPDEIITRYGFDPDTRTVNIDTKIYDWQ